MKREVTRIFSWLPLHKAPPEPNKQGPFPVFVTIPPARIMHGNGTVISASGLTFVLDFPLPGKSCDVTITIRERKIPIRATIKSAEPAGGRKITYVVKYVGIKADDWDRIVRYIHDYPDFDRIGSYFDPEIPDDNYRLLPLKIQEQIISELVARNRLLEPRPGSAPLIRMKKVGEKRGKDGYVSRTISIHSRILIDSDGEGDDHKDSDTTFVIDSNGNVDAH